MSSNSQWVYEAPTVNGGKETIDDMSLMVGMYDDFIVTKAGFLVGIIEMSGINIDLLSDYEQAEVFENYSTFLKASVEGGGSRELQFIELPVPVDLTDYISNLKKRYIELKNDVSANENIISLIASYIDYYSDIQAKQAMMSKKHLLVVKQKIKNKTQEELDEAEKLLTEKINYHVCNLEDTFSEENFHAVQLLGHEVLAILKNLINFYS